jgi:hypothetical protein
MDSKEMELCPSAKPFTLLLKGRIRTYTIEVIPPGVLVFKGEAEMCGPLTDSPPTASVELTLGERKLLAALSEPLLTRSGPRARPATYEEAASRLRIRPHTVRNHVDGLRQRLVDLYVPVGDDKDKIVHYMVNKKIITAADLSLLDASC